MKSTGDLQLLKRINRSALLRLIRSHPDLSRARLAAHSGLTKSTVSALVRELIDTHWLSEASAPVAAPGLGRPSTPLNINCDKRVLMGIEIAVETVCLVCVTLDGSIRLETTLALTDRSPASACRQMADAAFAMYRQLEANNWLLTGVGVCLPGAVNEDLGIVLLAPNLRWRDVAFLEMVCDAFQKAGLPPVPVHLQNDADAAALSEYEFGSHASEDPLIFINCDVGVGAGVVLNDRLYTGNAGTAGEVGHTILQVDGPLCTCGRNGCAETFIGMRALAQPTGVQRGGRYLGIMMQNLDAIFNPRVLVLGGRSCVEYPELTSVAQDTLHTYARQAGLVAPQVRAARYGLQAAAMGAAALVLHRYLRPLIRNSQELIN